MVTRPKTRKSPKQGLDDEVKMLRSEVKRLKQLVEMLMDIVVDMNDELDFEEDFPGQLQPGHNFDLNSAM
jgi:hypothetical protein